MADDDKTAARKSATALALVERHAASREALILKLIKALIGLWTTLPDWENWDLVTAHAARSAVIVDTILSQVRVLERSYGTAMLRTLDAAPPRSLPPLEDIYPRSGVTALEAYKRPAEQYRWEKSKGSSDDDARKAAEKRLRDLAEADVMLAARDEIQKVYKTSPKVLGRRRVIHPELAKSKQSCGLCVVASTRMYFVEELQPIHDGCNCDDVPVTAQSDPGLTLNQEDLERLYDAAGSTAAEDLKRVRVTVTEHGELGPLLVREGQHFRDVGEVNRTSRRRYQPFERMTIEKQRESWTAMRASSERSIEILERAKTAGTNTVDLTGRGRPVQVKDIDQAIKYHRELITRFTAKLR